MFLGQEDTQIFFSYVASLVLAQWAFVIIDWSRITHYVCSHDVMHCSEYFKCCVLLCRNKKYGKLWGMEFCKASQFLYFL
jgi:hypothetical protein